MYNGIDHPLLNEAYHEWDFEMKRIEREYTDKAIKTPSGSIHRNSWRFGTCVTRFIGGSDAEQQTHIWRK